MKEKEGLCAAGFENIEISRARCWKMLMRIFTGSLRGPEELRQGSRCRQGLKRVILLLMGFLTDGSLRHTMEKVLL